MLSDSRRTTRTHPSHRQEKPPKDRRFVVVGSVSAACAAVALSVGLATGGGAIGATAPASTSNRTAPASAAPAAPVSVIAPVVESAVSATDGASVGPVTGGTTVTVTGAALSDVTKVTFGDNPGTVVSATDTTVTITTPASTVTGPVAVELFDSAGTAVDVASAESTAPADPASVTPAGSSLATVAEGSAAAGSSATPPATATPAASDAGTGAAASVTSAALTFKYVPDPRVTAQLDYALAHWEDYNSVYGALSGNDCVNFTSQTLLARGWAMDAEWSADAGSSVYSPAWASSTAFAAYLAAHPERATPLSDSQRDRVKVGDVVQFDWDNSGDEDHTGIVSRVEKTGAGVQVYYAGHTSDTDYKSVDESLDNSGGSVSYWSVA